MTKQEFWEVCRECEESNRNFYGEKFLKVGRIIMGCIVLFIIFLNIF